MATSSDIPSTQERIEALVRVSPVHDLPKRARASLGAAVKRRTGRPQQVALAPTMDDSDYAAHIEEQREEWIDDDPLVRISGRATQEAGEVFRTIEHELAREAAALSFQAKLLRARGSDTAQVTSRRVDGLTKLAAVALARARFFGDELSDTKIETVRRLFISAVADVARDVLTEQQAALFADEIELRTRQGPG